MTIFVRVIHRTRTIINLRIYKKGLRAHLPKHTDQNKNENIIGPPHSQKLKIKNWIYLAFSSNL